MCIACLCNILRSYNSGIATSCNITFLHFQQSFLLWPLASFSPLCTLLYLLLYLFVLFFVAVCMSCSVIRVFFLICGHILKGLNFAYIVRVNKGSCCVFRGDNEQYGEAVKSELMELRVCLAARPWCLNVVAQMLIDPSLNETLKSSFLLFNPPTINCNTVSFTQNII